MDTFISKTKATIYDFSVQRTAIYNKLRRCEDEEEIAGYKAERDRLSEQIAELRKDVKTAEGVMERSMKMKENLLESCADKLYTQNSRLKYELIR